jgi:peptidoglycan hydrolase-like protein with peptidoglycan-binding domain
MHINTKTIFSYALTFALLIATITNSVSTKAQSPDPDFNPNYLLSDESFATTKIFPHERAIQEYLDSKNSPLRNYTIEGARASHWIYTAARGITSSAYNIKPNLNPSMLLAYLEKEQSLISLTNYDTGKDPERRIKTAMGYGCPDNVACNPKYEGFVNQLNYAAYQLQYNFVIATKYPNETFRVGNTIKTLDDKEVVLTNAATASAYRYTPHVFYSGYNLWKIMTDNKWGESGAAYSGNMTDNTSPNITLDNKFKVNFEDTEIPNPPSKQNGTIIITDPQSGPQKQNNCDALFKQNWTFGTIDVSVEKLQQCLRDKNMFDHVVTGYFGPITKTGLEKARATSQVPVVIQNNNQPNYGNGVIVITSTPTNQSAQDNCNNLKTQTWIYGTTNDEVEKLQRCMQKIGVFNHVHGATGYFGPVTQKALDSWRGMA